ncbi:MAG: ABC transporter ATP-binding protein [Gemmatimonadaceae bacterium]
MNAIVVENLSFAFGKAEALEDVSFTVPEGALYALIGPNGAGKSTLLQILAGLRNNYKGRARMFGSNCAKFTPQDREHIGYVAEGQKLPDWMRLEQLEAYLAPWYPTWDFSLANELRERFALDATQQISKFSRGQYMKAALLCALAPRPKVLLMDEPFTGMDVGVKDELVRGLLSASAADGCTIVLSSHDIAEIEMLADHVGYLQSGKLRLSESMENLRERFKHVDVVLADDALLTRVTPTEWIGFERADRRIQFVMAHDGDDAEQLVKTHYPNATRVELRQATLREFFLAQQRTQLQVRNSLPTMEQAS